MYSPSNTDGDTTTLPLWQTVLIGVCGVIVLGVLTVLFCVLLCCGCKASKKWGRKEYHTGPSEYILSLASPSVYVCDYIGFLVEINSASI